MLPLVLDQTNGKSLIRPYARNDNESPICITILEGTIVMNGSSTGAIFTSTEALSAFPPTVATIRVLPAANAPNQPDGRSEIKVGFLTIQVTLAWTVSPLRFIATAWRANVSPFVTTNDTGETSTTSTLSSSMSTDPLHAAKNKQQTAIEILLGIFHFLIGQIDFFAIGGATLRYSNL
jgi:hypothetical protein